MRFCIVALVVLCGLTSLDAGDFEPGVPPHARASSPSVQQPVPAAAGDVINSVPYAGVAPLGVCVGPAETLYVVDLFAGSTHLYDLGLGLLGSIPNPGGTSTHSGIFYNPISGFLHFVAYSNAMMYVTDLDGVFQMALPLASPTGGNVGGIDHDELTNTLWMVDIVNDQYYEFELDGTYTGNSFASPAGTPSFGNGLTNIDGTSLLDVPAGTLATGQVDTLFRIDTANGNTVVEEYSLSGVPDTFLNGLAYHPTGSTGIEVHYFVGNATSTLFEVETLPVGMAQPEFVRGDVNGDGSFAALEDGIALLNWGFVPGTPEPACLAAADVNGDLQLLVIPDAIHLFNFAFIPGSPPIAPPFPACGTHPPTTDAVGCLTTPCP